MPANSSQVHCQFAAAHEDAPSRSAPRSCGAVGLEPCGVNRIDGRSAKAAANSISTATSWFQLGGLARQENGGTNAHEPVPRIAARHAARSICDLSGERRDAEIPLRAVERCRSIAAPPPRGSAVRRAARMSGMAAAIASAVTAYITGQKEATTRSKHRRQISKPGAQGQVKDLPWAKVNDVGQRKQRAADQQGQQPRVSREARLQRIHLTEESRKEEATGLSPPR